MAVSSGEILEGMLDSGVTRWIEFYFFCSEKTKSIKSFYLFSCLEKS